MKLDLTKPKNVRCELGARSDWPPHAVSWVARRLHDRFGSATIFVRSGQECETLYPEERVKEMLNLGTI